MPANPFLRLLADKPFLLADGATGTNLFGMGLQTGDAPELWNTAHPDRISRHYRSFVEAGSDIVLTNTFGGNRRRLALHQAEHRVYALNVAAARLLRAEVSNAGRAIAVAGSIGPTGDILEPTGDLSISDAADVFTEQAQALADGGVDVFWIETLSSSEEVQAAVSGVGRVSQKTGIPIVNTLSIDTNGRTMMGLTAADIVALQPRLEPHPVACGTNCGVGASEVVAAVLNFSNAHMGDKKDTVFVAKANCGIPEYVDGEIVYNGTPELMARYTELAMDAGARIIGGCCGTSPAHIAAMRQAMDSHTPQTAPTLEKILSELGEVSAGAQAQLGGDLSTEGGAVNKNSGSRRVRRRQKT